MNLRAEKHLKKGCGGKVRGAKVVEKHFSSDQVNWHPVSNMIGHKIVNYNCKIASILNLLQIVTSTKDSESEEISVNKE